MRVRKKLNVGYDAPTGSMLLDQYGAIVGQVVAARQLDEAPIRWEIEADVEDDTDLERLQVLSVTHVTGNING